MTLQIEGLFEAHLTVRDLDRSVAFYRDVLGLSVASGALFPRPGCHSLELLTILPEEPEWGCAFLARLDSPQWKLCRLKGNG